MIVRTQGEIVEKINSLDKFDDMFRVKRFDLMDWLDFEHIKQFLKDGVTEQEWNNSMIERWEKYKTPIDELIDYLPFALEKAHDKRGLSAIRSLHHMSAWLWLVGDDNLLDMVQNDCSNYGIKSLEAIKNKYAPEMDVNND